MTALIDDYLQARRAAGFELRVPESLLRSFARACEAAGDTRVRIATATGWAAQAPSIQQRGRRLRTVALFAEYVHAEDPRHEIPRSDVFDAPRLRRVPHIYTSAEIARLLAEAGRLGPADSLHPLTYQTIFGLLAACGLRISEALALLLTDVTGDGLTVRRTKFRKIRLVPLHESTRRALGVYLARRSAVVTDSLHLFVSARGDKLAYATFNATFLKVARSVGLRAAPGQPGPRLHDLRHTFAVRALESCKRDEVAQHMQALSTYLGHTRLADTYWYLQATPHLMTGIADACRQAVEVTP